MHCKAGEQLERMAQRGKEMPTGGIEADAREYTLEIGVSDGLGANLTRAAAAVHRDQASERRDIEANVRDGIALTANLNEGSS